MQSPLRRRIRHLRRLLGYGALVVLILAATVVGALNQVLPLVERHPEKVAAWLSERIGEPVAFDAASAQWTRRGPRFTLQGLRIGEGERVLDIGRAELLVAVYSGLLPGAPLTELRVRELSLALVRGDDGRWKLDGLPFEPRPDVDPLDTLEALGELQVERASLVVRAGALASELHLPRVDLRLRVRGDGLVAGLRAWAVEGGRPIAGSAELRRGDWSGQLWVGGRDLDLGEWSPLLADTGLVVAGAGDLDLWARIQAQRVADVRSRAELAPLALGARTPWFPREDGSLHSPPAAFERVDLLARWQAQGEGWQLHAPELHFHQRGRERPLSLDGLWVAGGEAWALQAPRVDFAPARALAVLSPRLPDGLRRWLQQAAPEGQLRNLRVQGQGGRFAGSAGFEGIGWWADGGQPGLRSLSGSAAFDQAGGVMKVRGPVEFDWAGFREPLAAELGGTLGWWRDGEAWTLGAAGLRLRGPDYGTTLRAELAFGGPGRRPRLDLAADVDPSSFAAAKRFWVVGKMPPATIDWLDTALVSGEVLDSRAVLAGDLDDWPFRAGEGRFDARTRVSAATVAFRPDWPAAEGMELDVAFDGPGMAIEGRGGIAGNPVARVAGGIADFKAARLVLDITTETRGEDLQALVSASPLRAGNEAHLDNASVRGPVAVGLQLDLPLSPKAGDARRIEGRLDLRGVRLADPRWDIVLERATGGVDFHAGGFSARALDVRFDGHPAAFSLQVGDDTGDGALGAVAELQGRFPATPLLARHPPLQWLGSRLEGEADWRLRVDVPAGGPRVGPANAAPLPARLRVESDLAGLAVDLPAPLAKPADGRLALRLDTPLPLARGEVRLALGEDLVRLRGRVGEDDSLAAAIRFGPGDVPAPPPLGLEVSGRSPSLDAAGWVGFAGDGGGVGSLREVDLQVDSLDLLGAPFAATRVRLSRQPAGTQLRLDGEAVSGTVEVPAGERGAILGRFARLHWPEKAPADAEGGAAGDAGRAPGVGEDAGAAAAVAEAPPAPDQDPTGLPALDFQVEDLRLGTLVLGRAELQAVPSATGLRIERFATRADELALSASGEWRRVGEGRAESEFSVEFEADSLGDLLGAFGLAGMVEDGPTTGRLAGRWPGSPGSFALARFTGTLRAEVGEGALLEVEPGGGGRVLGLISLAEIPRRLTLDFSDFFSKGFGFNTMAGEFVFEDGVARTDLLQINGPAAEIRVSGSTDLRRQVYDQRIEVLPKAGGVLPAIGAIAGGPVGAAVGAVAQAVLQKPLKRAARTVYHVTGPWREPVVEVVEKGAPEEPAADDPAPARQP